MKYKSIFFILAYSFLFLPIWGLLFFDATNSNSFSILVGLVYSYISSSMVQETEIFNKIKKYSYYYVLIGPLIYLVISLFTFPIMASSLLNPILWAFCMLCLSFIISIKFNIKLVSVLVFFSYFYSYHLYPIFKGGLDSNLLINGLSS